MEIGHMKSFGIQSDLDEIKRLSKCFLYLEPEETQFSPMLVHHPFTSCGFVGLRDDAGDVQIGNILEKEDDRARWQKQLGKVIDDSRDVFEIYSRIEKPYALAFLKYATPFLSQKDFSLILGDAWLRSEQPNHDPNLSQKQLLKMFAVADPKILMEDVEQKRLSELDVVVTVYRGTHSDKPNSERALSWTLNRDTAQWFANRYGKDGTLYEAKIEKEHIHALFLRREESEVILDPKYLTEVVQVPKMEQAEEITMGGMKW